MNERVVQVKIMMKRKVIEKRGGEKGGNKGETGGGIFSKININIIL